MEIQLPHHHGQPIEKICGTMPSVGDFSQLADVFRQLSDPSRMRIFWLLQHGEECVINISAIMGMTSPAVSHHLRLLKNAGLLSSRRDGKEVYYRAAEGEPARTLHGLIEKLAEIVCPLE